MKLWPLFSLILLAGPTGAQDSESVTRPRDRESATRSSAPSVTIEQLGEAALASGLWEIAALHFHERLADPSLDAAARSATAIRLAEALVRGGDLVEALDLLAQSFVSGDPAAPFWKAQAFAAQHRFNEALEILSRLLAEKSTPHRTEAAFTAASLQLALGRPEEALETLSQLLPEADPATQAKTRLQQVEILLDLERVAKARATMPARDNIAAPEQPLAAFLEAKLELAEGRSEQAEAAFQDLINHPDGQSLIRYHSAALGLADATTAKGDPQQASASLVTYLQKYPDSPVLEAAFKRILEWLPEKPAATDPTLAALDEWIQKPLFPAVLPLDATRSGAVAAWPVPSAAVADDRTPFAMYVRGIGLHRIGTPEALTDSRILFQRLRLTFPDHRLAKRALYQSARWKLEEGVPDAALALLEILRDTAESPNLKGEAAYLAARAAISYGDLPLAIRRFDEAASLLDEPDARRAKLQQAIASLHAGDKKGLQLIQATAAAQDPQLDADIELERALATTPAEAARTALEKFLARFPDHPRAAEARIAAVEVALSAPEPAVDFAREQLEILTDKGESGPRIALARMRIADLKQDPATADLARGIMETYPDQPAARTAAFTLGRLQFQEGNTNDARMVLENLAATDPDAARAQAAWLLAARAAALGGTPKSKEEALVLFDKAIAADGPLQSVATLEKASHLIDMARLAEASDFLSKWLKTLPKDDPLQLPAGLLLGSALYAQGSGNPDSLVEALAVYDKLLAQVKNQPALFNRLQFLRGTTLELLPDKKDPTKKRETEAFEAYHSVLETTVAPAEWEYFESCGFHALALLEKAKRWQAAISVARKIASFKGPRAEEAATRANKIQLDQMIY